MRNVLVFACLSIAGFCLYQLRSPGVAAGDHPEIRPVFENYSIRLDTSTAADEVLRRYRSQSSFSNVDRDVVIERMAAAEHRLRQSVSGVVVEYGDELHTPEIIGTSAISKGVLAKSTGSNGRERTLRTFIYANKGLFGVTEKQIVDLTLEVGQSARASGISIVDLQQSIGGVPVFQGTMRAAFDRGNKLVRVINYLAPGPFDVRDDFGAPERAVAAAARNVGIEIAKDSLRRSRLDGKNVIFQHSSFADVISAEKFYFPIERGVIRPAWCVLLWLDTAAYYVVVDAADQELLWRKNITESQTQASTYSVYGSLTAMTRAADSPAPGTPSCPSPNPCPQPAMIARTPFTLIGNEPPYTFNNNGWVADGENRTIGNAAEAGIDRDGTQGVDNNGWAFSDAGRNFVFAYDPAPGLTPPGQSPLPTGTQPYPPTPFQQGSATNAFYLANRWHDETYLLGFNESSRNFQTDNFGRGGISNDSLSVEIQDGTGSNSANFSTPADGIRPRAQFFVWTSSTPARDGALDAQIVLHEFTHGLSNRLIGNATGLTGNMARGMGEGWSDFFALALLSEPTDDTFGTYAVGCYSSYQIIPGFDSNCYYGLRRFPVARRGSVGPNGLPHNPLTFRYLNSDCNTLIGTTTSNPPPNSAFPRGPIGTTTCDQVNNFGEVWTVALWEVRASLIDALGPAEGNRRALQYITDGMKLSPLNPTVLQMRDAILVAAQAANPSDVRHVWRGFAMRGMGVLASIQDVGSGNNNTVVTESFDLPVGPRPLADFDGDGRSDVSVFRPSDGNWYIQRSTAGFIAANFGLAGDRPVPADFDGDGKADIAIFRPTADAAAADFYVLRSSNFAVSYISWGSPGDLPAIGDFDGDGKADPAIFRPADHRFYVLQSSNGVVLVSRPSPNDVPVSGDFDFDGKADFATFGEGRWNWSRSSDGHLSGVMDFWGSAGDNPAAGDYDGDGKLDLAIFRPSDGVWYIKKSSGGNDFVPFGIASDIPSPGDFDGDGRTDIAVYRNGVWYILRSSSGILITQFGLANDLPLTAAGPPQ
ncbi:MAG TPA: M36 family metallopeptidase [Pyrinomonadaceae bacterium]|nr:M36 family metallopeptidase [Chloracidobacterium sp.]MBP9108003.1 M36 family metallopeptidase [Pyrinomonadaceae bacterium]MBK9437000.1 M36 family metallopeptidase [Chloracidobacterium sp.]MBL0241992.1 M36 family metallopeptidase [Chloracidobacterium sp.]HQX54807.1 M36 family metallopeptidase [Pyrinomonadaceae bacterium]